MSTLFGSGSTLSDTRGLRAAGSSLNRTAERPSVWWKVIAPLALLKMAFQLGTATVYGMHRDEFYYWQSGRHLAWGYVDNPPLVPWLYRLQELAFGTHQMSFAVVPAALGALYVVLAVMMVVDLGGGHSAQIVAAAVAWLAPIYLTPSHFLSTVSLDLVFWALASWLVIRLVRTGDTRLWIAVGAVCGIALLNKDTIVFWAAAAAIGLLSTPERTLLRSRWALVGGGLAVLIASPNIVWEASHHWATLEFLRNLRSQNSSSDIQQFVPLQLAIMTLAGTAVWVAALHALRRRPEWRSQRWLAHGYLAAFLLLFILEGKAYYLGSWYLPLISVGAIVIERSWSRHAQKALLASVVVTGVATGPIFTPVLPIRTAVAAGFDTANKDLGGMLGWPHVVAQIASVVDRLPPAERADAVVFTQNYSEAGAVDWYGPGDGIAAHAISGQNSFWIWGYGHPLPGAVVVAVGIDPSFLHRYWGTVDQVQTLGSDATTIDPQERGVSIWICQGQKQPWSTIWPSAKHYP